MKANLKKNKTMKLKNYRVKNFKLKNFFKFIFEGYKNNLRLG